MRKRRSGFRLLLWLLAALMACTVLPVALLRWLPPPTSAYILQSPVTPVQHRWVPWAQISPAMAKAVVASEDQKFWQHHGFDLQAIEKARVHNERSRKKRGASTISQQTAKNLFLWPGGGYFRKGIEAGYTVLIEALWPKQRILEMYLNLAEFGPGIYGVEAAAQAFFGKPAARLSNGEAARLAAVLPSPRHWNARQPGPYVQRRADWILRQIGAARPVADEPEPEMPEAMRRQMEDEERGHPSPAAAQPTAAPELSPDAPPEPMPMPTPVPIPEPSAPAGTPGTEPPAPPP